MSKSFTLTRIGGPVGLLGSVLVISALLFGVLFPNNNLPSAPVYGVGALLLLVNVASLLLERKGSPKALAVLSLAVVLLSLAVVTTYAVLDTLARGSVENAWYVLVTALLLTVLGMSIYAITALVARALPVWVGLPLAFTGIALLVVTLGVSSGLFNLRFSSDERLVNVATLVLMLTFFAMWGLMSLISLRGTVDESSASPDLSPRPGVTI